MDLFCQVINAFLILLAIMTTLVLIVVKDTIISWFLYQTQEDTAHNVPQSQTASNVMNSILPCALSAKMDILHKLMELAPNAMTTVLSVSVILSVQLVLMDGPSLNSSIKDSVLHVKHHVPPVQVFLPHVLPVSVDSSRKDGNVKI